MQDFSYAFTNCLEFSVELACNWIPDENLIQVNHLLDPPDPPHGQTHWKANKQAFMGFLEQADTVVRGLVTDRVRLGRTDWSNPCHRRGGP